MNQSPIFLPPKSERAWVLHNVTDRFYQRPDVEACRTNNIIYLRNWKCGSTFYYNNFVKKFGWEPIHFTDIDWRHDHVFGHIMHPIQRRHKGVAEYMKMTGTAHLLERPDFAELVRHVPYFDIHSASYHDLFGAAAWLVDWIPLNGGTAASIAHTEKLLWSRNIRIMGRWDWAWTHPSTQDLLDTEQRLQQLWDEKDVSYSWNNICFDRDQRLYNSVVEGFEPNAAVWSEASWLRVRGRDGN